MSTITITVAVIEEREKARKISYQGQDVWLPVSQIERYKFRPSNPPSGLVLGQAEVTIPSWLFDEKFES